MIDTLKTSLAAVAEITDGKTTVAPDEAKARIAALRSHFTEATERWNALADAALEKALEDAYRIFLPFLDHDSGKLHNLVHQLQDNAHRIHFKSPARLPVEDVALLIREVENFLAKIASIGPEIGLTPAQLSLGTIK